MELDEAVLDELIVDITYDIEQSVDPLTLFNGDNVDEARVATLTSAVGNVAEHVGDGILSGHVDRGLVDNELREIVAVCFVWLAQTTEQTISEIIDHVKRVVPTSKPFTTEIQGRPLSRLVTCLAAIVDTIPAADSRGGPENYLVALAGQTVLWILELRSGQQT